MIGGGLAVLTRELHLGPSLSYLYKSTIIRRASSDSHVLCSTYTLSTTDTMLSLSVSEVEVVIGGIFVPPSSRGESLEMPSSELAQQSNRKLTHLACPFKGEEKMAGKSTKNL